MEESFFTVEATGQTYRIKDDLQSWAFFWDPAKRAWISECTDTNELRHFMSMISHGRWAGVILSCTKNADYSFTD